MRLLVGYDGSDEGRDALALARLLSSEEESSVLVVAVMPYGPLPVRFVELESDAAAAAEPLFEDARKQLQGAEVETRAFGGGSPAGVMTDLAERREVDSIVVGSPHRGPVGRTLIGSVAEGVLHGAPCAVTVAPGGYSERDRRPLGLIAIAYDGTPEAKAALARARALAEASGATVRVLTVVAPPVALPGVVGYTPVEPPEPDRVIEEAVRELGPEVSAESRKLDGPPARTLAKACEDGVDLLVSGSRGYGPMMRVLLGSVSTQLIAEAPCPVMVVPRPQDGRFHDRPHQDG
jgi:nucleotide-binding universal stress UspA family protein